MQKCKYCQVEKSIDNFSFTVFRSRICYECKREKRVFERRARDRKKYAVKYPLIKNLEGEEWKSIIGYDGLYKISSHGRVKSRHFITRPTILLKPNISKLSGYKKISLSKNGKLEVALIHILVATHFISAKPENKDFRVEVNHIDTDKMNNHYKNLEWSTTPDNMSKRYKFKQRAAPRMRTVYQIHPETNKVVATYKSYPHAVKGVKAHQKAASKYLIHAVNTGEQMFGYLWRRYTRDELGLLPARINFSPNKGKYGNQKGRPRKITSNPNESLSIKFPNE